MKDYLLFMDVSGDIAKSYVEQGKINLIPMEFVIGGDVYQYTDDSNGIDPVKFYEFVKQKTPMSTTQISPAKWTEFFQPYLEKGQSVLCLCLSSGLSNSYNSAVTAANELNAKYSDAKFVPVDSIRATGITGLIAERMIENKDKGLDIDENAADLEQFKHKTAACAYVDDLDSLKRGGRISRTVAFFGGLMDIKPLIQFNADGTLSVWGKQRGYKKSIANMIEYYLDKTDLENAHTVYITHANDETYANELAEKVRAVNPKADVKIRLLSPIIGVHLGPSAMVLGFVTK